MLHPLALRAAGALVIYAALYEAIAAMIYVTGDPGHFDPLFRAKYTLHLTLVIAHAGSSCLALACGPVQLLPLPRKWHRRVGYAYVAGVLGGSTTGLVMSFIAEGGPIALSLIHI